MCTKALLYVAIRAYIRPALGLQINTDHVYINTIINFPPAAIDPTTVTSDSTNPGPTQLIVPTAMQPRAQQVAKSTNTPHSSDTKTSTSTPTAPVRISAAVGGNTKLTINDVERERGKPLTKYERNMMIFNWLHTLDEAATEEVSAQ